MLIICDLNLIEGSLESLQLLLVYVSFHSCLNFQNLYLLFVSVLFKLKSRKSKELRQRYELTKLRSRKKVILSPLEDGNAVVV